MPTIVNELLTAPGVRTAPLYRSAALLESAKTRRPPERRSHRGPGFAAACTEGKNDLRMGRVIR